MVDFYIEEVFPKNVSCTLIADFLNGYPADNFTDQHCEVLEHKITRGKYVASEINNIIYAGDECNESLGKTLMLARNRKTGKVRLIEVSNVELRPVMKSVVEEAQHETSYVDLGRKFGSKRHKKALEQNEKLKVNEEVVMEQLQNVSQNVSQDQLDLSSYNKTDSEDFYIPPINREANTLEDVYMLSAILTAEQFETIYNEISNTDFKPNLFPIVKDIFSDNWSKEKIVLAVYASTLLHVYLKTLRSISMKKCSVCECSETLDEIIKREFFVVKTRSLQRPLQYRDKTLCHAIVFILLINNYKLDADSLHKQLKMVERTGNMKIAMTGAWITKQGNKKIAVLKLPLNKASSGMGRRKSARF